MCLTPNQPTTFEDGEQMKLLFSNTQEVEQKKTLLFAFNWTLATNYASRVFV